MSKLADDSCVACLPGTARLSGDELRQLLSEVPGWMICCSDDHMYVERVFTFRISSQHWRSRTGWVSLPNRRDIIQRSSLSGDGWT